MRINRLLFSLVAAILLLNSCSHTPATAPAGNDEFIIRDFNPVTNWKPENTLFLDYRDAIHQGFIIPTERQVDGGFFIMEFQIQNLGKIPQKFHYKVYYQNESYKFPEQDPADTNHQHPNAWENFYGSWENPGIGFVETPEIPNDGEFHRVTSRFRILGNPRNERRYFNGTVNERYKRNPRVGEYGFLLVVTTGQNISQNLIAEDVVNIGKETASGFVHPWFYFLHGAGKTIPNTVIQKSPLNLKVVAKPDPGAGIYLNPIAFSQETSNQYATQLCGQTPELHATAAYEQFIHYVDPSTKLNNIPVINDILNSNYSRLDYNWNKRFYRKEELIATTSHTSSQPCQTVISDPENHKIIMKNPRSTFGDWKKENVGVITRHGLIFGKYTVKCKLTELLNKQNMWNGLTNAIWLITQSQEEWNYRRDCTREGYMATYWGGQQDKRVKNVGYSEIDFEILKTVPYCPSWVLPPAYNHGIDDQYNLNNWNVPFPEEVLTDDDKIMVSCTNWDMACWQPADFRDGCTPIRYEGKTFWAHRWDKSYRALTQKTPERDDELFASPYYYFQIDWQPDKIIWRIGPSKDKMRVVGYQDDKVTSIPNNQMLLIITQEFHNTKWWVGSAYSQDNVPFPGADYVGEIYELTIE